MSKKRITAAIGFTIFACALAWIAGFNFDSRGPWQAYFTLVCGFIVAAILWMPA